MSRISGLPDDLLVKILSFLPTKVAVSTSILSKQWEFLWTWLPKLEFKNIYNREESTLKEFIDKNLPLHRAHVIESLRLDIIARHIKPEDIKRWIEIAVSRCVRELKVSYFTSIDENMFPSSFYTCESLVILKVEGVDLMDVPSMVSLPSLETLKLKFVTLIDVPSMVCILPSLETLRLEYVTLMDVPSTGCLPSLKTLQIRSVTYKGKDSLQRLLSICPVLEELSVHFGEDDMAEFIVEKFTVIVPSLQRLSLFIPEDLSLEGYEIDTPSLKYFKLEDWCSSGHYSEIQNMPMLSEAYVDVVSSDLKSVVESITSVKRLTICAEDFVYGDGFVFNELEYLKICVCKKDSSNLLAQLLKDSPNLRVLEISHMKDHGSGERNRMVRWKQPSPVPECLLSSLQIFKWSRYFGRRQDRDIAVYMLKNARRLKAVTILADTRQHHVSDLRMIKELTLSSRASTTCELVFVERHHVVSDESSDDELV